MGTMKYLRSDAISKERECGVSSDLGAIARGVLAGAMNNWIDPKQISLEPAKEKQ